MSIGEIQYCGSIGWVAEVKASGNGVKILPRILFEGWSVADFRGIFTDLEKMTSLGNYMRSQLEVSR